MDHTRVVQQASISVRWTADRDFATARPQKLSGDKEDTMVKRGAFTTAPGNVQHVPQRRHNTELQRETLTERDGDEVGKDEGSKLPRVGKHDRGVDRILLHAVSICVHHDACRSLSDNVAVTHHST